jgi:nucleoside-diphosphate-sugar epimerase
VNEQAPVRGTRASPGGGVLITGGAGFVGAHVARACVEAGIPVALLDRRQPGGVLRRVVPPEVPLHLADVCDPAQVTAAVAASGAAGIIHTAAVVGPAAALADPLETTRVNVMGTQAVLEAARRGALRVTYLSTATLYGRRPDLRPCREDDPPDPVGLYDATKYIGETLVLTYQRTFGVDAAVVRASFVYGPGASVGEYFLVRVLGQEPVEEPAGADHPCDFTYVDDLAAGIVRAHTVRPLTHRVFNIAGGVLRTRGELAAAVRAVVPGARITLGPGVDAARHLRGPCDLTRAGAELRYAPAFTLEQGVAAWRTVLIEAEP